MKIRLLQLGKTSESFIDEGCKHFEKRIKGFISFEVETISTLKIKISDPEGLKKKESELILSALHQDEIAILLDEKGKNPTSREFAAELQHHFNSGKKRITFIIGGAFGFGEDVYKAVPQKLSISKMTFSHQLIRVIALEQIYRALSILHNHPYHND
jgi:23S rRNA (pseudouridine1915-N3)-methyltransferase